MIYTSCNGCLFYFDRILYKWSYADPTMLFILGLDSILAYNFSVSNYIIIPREYYNSAKNETISLRNFELFDDIHSYLNEIGQVEDNDSYIKYDCNGLKLIMNELTGMDTDRTVPVIFKNDINKKLIDVTKESYRIPSSDRINLSYYDIQARIIKNIFEDAGYNKEPIDHLSSKNQSDSAAIAYINSYNDSIDSINNERIDNKDTYKLLDYKAMYSYALGILYGCRCLGYNNEYIWRLPPKYWYNGKFTNLVETAWVVFRFYHTAFIDEFMDDPSESLKYQNIVYNKLWNFDDDLIRQSLSNLPMMPDENSGYILSVDSINNYSGAELTNELISSLVKSKETFYSNRLSGEINITKIICNFIDESVEVKSISSISCLGSNIPTDAIFRWSITLNTGSETTVEPTVVTNVPILSDLTVVYDESSYSQNPITTINQAISDSSTSGIIITASVKINDGEFTTATEIYNTLVEDGSYTYTTPPGKVSNYVTPPGKYLNISEDDFSWKDIANLTSYNQGATKYGIIDYDTVPMIRYIANDMVLIYRASVWGSSNGVDLFISPEHSYNTPESSEQSVIAYNNPDTNYFIYTGAVGWSNFNDQFLEPDTDCLSIVPKPYSSLGKGIGGAAGVYVLESGVAYYKCAINESDYIYGIFDGKVEIDANDNITFKTTNNFKYILSQQLFDKYYGQPQS